MQILQYNQECEYKLTKDQYHSRLDVDVDLVPELPPPLAQHGRAQEEPGGPVSVPAPPVHLAHEIDGRLGGGVVESLQGPRPAAAAEEARREVMFRRVMVLEEGERADVAFRCKRGRST